MLWKLEKMSSTDHLRRNAVGTWKDLNNEMGIPVPRFCALQAAELPRIRLIHGRNLPCDVGPLELPLDRLATLQLLHLLPLEELVSEAEVWLDDDVETSSANVAAT